MTDRYSKWGHKKTTVTTSLMFCKGQGVSAPKPQPALIDAHIVWSGDHIKMSDARDFREALNARPRVLPDIRPNQCVYVW